MKKKIIKELKREKKLKEKKKTSRIGERIIKNRKNNVRLPPFHFVYISTMARKTITSQNRSLCDDLGLKWLPGPKPYIGRFPCSSSKKIHYTFSTSAPVPNRGVLELETTLQQQVINNK